MLAFIPCMARAAALELQLGRLAHPAFIIDGLSVSLGAEGGAARVSIRRLTVGERRWDRLAFHCQDFRLADGVIRCRGGSLQVPGLIEGAQIDGEIEPARKLARLELRMRAGERIGVVAHPDGTVELETRGVSLAMLQEWLPQIAAYRPSGRLEGRATLRPASDGLRVSVSGKLVDGAFSSEDGLRAAEGVTLEADVDAGAHGSRWAWSGRIAWSRGEAYLHPLYLTAGPVVEIAGELGDGVITVRRASLVLDGVRAVAAQGSWDLEQGRLRDLAASVADADLAVIGPRFLAPMLFPARAEALRFAGSVSAGVEYDEGALTSFDLAFDGAGFSLSDEALFFGPVSGTIPWRAQSPTEAMLTVSGGRWQKLGLGAFDLHARLDGRSVDVARATIPLLDGALVLQDIALRRGATGWYASGGLVVEPISMERLTDAVGLPKMSGVLSASLPGLRVAPGEISLDGSLIVSVFDGYLQATKLLVREPLGVASHLSADIEARHLDLAQLTETFSFGSITGFVDADIRGLELVRWRPVRFDARLASSPGRYRRRISQRAVQNIGALGGAGAVAAIQRGFLGVFDSFGYSKIGLSCVLEGGVCRLDGLERAPGGGIYLVRGGGIPALNVIGYNQRVDWNEFVDRVQRVISSNTAPLIQ